MEGPLVGDVVSVDFPYADGAGGKRRPAVVVATPGDMLGSVILCAITSKSFDDAYHVPLRPGDFSFGALPREVSCVHVPALLASRSVMLGRTLGRLNTPKLATVHERIRNLFQ
jgi:mRNA interferase MazF